jgi:hypothetical protein
MARDADDIRRLFQSAAEILMPFLNDGVLTGRNVRDAIDGALVIDFAISAPPTEQPRTPTTREAALPQLLLQGPFKGAPNLHGVAFYVGIGFIMIRKAGAGRSSYEITAIDGNNVDARLAFLITARDLFFNDVQFEGSPS